MGGLTFILPVSTSEPVPVKRTFLDFTVRCPLKFTRSASCPLSDVSELSEGSDCDDSCHSPTTTTVCTKAEFTTVILKNLPRSFSVGSLTELLGASGLAGQYDFAYVPLHFKSGTSMGYSFVNFASSAHARRFQVLVNDAPLGDDADMFVAPARVQGVQANIDHFLNKSVNYADNEFRPVLFELGSGRVIAFPRPNVAKEPQRPRGSKARDGAALRLFVGGLSPRTTKSKLQKFFKCHMEIDVVDVSVVVDQKTGLSRGFGYVGFRSEAAMLGVMSGEPCMIDGRAVGLRICKGSLLTSLQRTSC